MDSRESDYACRHLKRCYAYFVTFFLHYKNIQADHSNSLRNGGNSTKHTFSTKCCQQPFQLTRPFDHLNLNYRFCM